MDFSPNNDNKELKTIFSNLITWGKSHSNKNSSYGTSWYALIFILQNKLSPLNGIVKRLMKTLVWDYEESANWKKVFSFHKQVSSGVTDVSSTEYYTFSFKIPVLTSFYVN